MLRRGLDFRGGAQNVNGLADCHDSRDQKHDPARGPKKTEETPGQSLSTPDHNPAKRMAPLTLQHTRGVKGMGRPSPDQELPLRTKAFTGMRDSVRWIKLLGKESVEMLPKERVEYIYPNPQERSRENGNRATLKERIFTAILGAYSGRKTFSGMFKTPIFN